MIFVLPGTFDPFTKGHHDIATRAAKLCDKLIIAVSDTSRHAMFSAEKRAMMARAAVRDVANAEVIRFNGLLPTFAQSLGATAIVRGVRSNADYEYEIGLMRNYKVFVPEIETIIIPTNPVFAHISSTVVRDLIIMKEDVSAYLSSAVLEIVSAETR